MVQRKLYFFLLLLASGFAFAQNEAKIWYFGINAGLDFNSGSPVALTDGRLQTLEGCATLCNSTGQILFYTDGITVWNRNHQIMPNGTGLLGHPSSTQSATIVQKPGDPNIFYLVTLDAKAGVNGLRYSEIDLSLNGGLGDVNANKNILLYTPSCEKIAMVKHANNNDIWLITHGYNNNTFYSHLITSSGFNPIPILSNSGVVVNGIDFDDIYNTQGYMKVSPDGSKLALSHQFLNTAQLFDFNNATGVVSNPITLLSNYTGQIYGAEFSPNGEVLYLTSAFGDLFQFDLTSSDIPSSQFLQADFTDAQLGALQLGPDGKIYIAQYNSTTLSVIDNPNALGASCNLLVDSVNLGRYSQFGLPAFNQSFFYNPSIIADNACVGQSTSFELQTNQTVTSATWNFGDGNTSTDLEPSHTYASAGTYTVSVITIGPFGTGTKTRDIVISAVPIASQPQDIKVCDNDNNGFYTFDLTLQNNAILNGQSSSQYSIRYFANATDFANNFAITTPATYQNTTAYQSQTIIAEVTNNANGDCKATTNFAIQVSESPNPAPSNIIIPITSCDNTTVGTDTDGKILFDLTQRNTVVLNGQSAANFTLSFYKDNALTQLIATPGSYANTNPIETVWVKMTNNQNPNCFAVTSFNIEVYSLPVVSSLVVLKQCDDNQDGFSAFNLEEAIPLLTTSSTGLTFTFFYTLADAQNNSNPITNTTSYTNQFVNTDVIYVKVQTINGCFRIGQVNLVVSTTQIPANFIRNFTVCDDTVSGSNTDGIATFDFSSADSDIRTLFPVGQLLDITYYRNLSDALAEQNAIADISNYTNIGYLFTQNIYVRVDSQLNNECLGLGHHITLNVERIPIVQPQVLRHCDDNQDGSYAFSTTNLESLLLNGLTNVTVSYTDQNGNTLPSPLPNPFATASQTINVTVANNTATACNYTSTIRFIVDDLPEAFAIPVNLTTVCDDEADPVLQNGSYPFDTTTFQSSILGTQTGMIVNYFDENNNVLPSPLPNPFSSETQNIRVEIINPNNPNCSTTSTIPLIVNPVPVITLSGEELVCSNDLNFTKVIDAGLLDSSTSNGYTYTWYLNGNIIPNETNYTLTVNMEGIYTVDVVNSYGCIRTRTITVTASNIATITNVQVTDLSENNSIVVHVAGQGNYVYSLDNVTFQESNVFYGITPGVYTVFVKDMNGCGIADQEVSVLGIPNFFTPNGDGFNDYWNIQGVSENYGNSAKIYIFDRYGKLLKQLSPQSEGWDGTYNGNPVPSNDYWYSIELNDGRIFKGHFALKR